jgi:hypothetical protein
MEVCGMANAEAMRRRAAARRALKTPQRPWVIHLVSALIAFGVAFVTVQIPAIQEHAKENRDRKAQVYGEYLVTVRKALDAQLDYPDLFQEFLDLEKQPRVTKAERDKAWLSVRQAREQQIATYVAWRKQVDLVYVYGSDDAWRAHTAFERFMPENPFGYSQPGSGYYSTQTLQRFREAERDFRKVFCKEAAVAPRAGCS